MEAFKGWLKTSLAGDAEHISFVAGQAPCAYNPQKISLEDTETLDEQWIEEHAKLLLGDDEVTNKEKAQGEFEIKDKGTAKILFLRSPQTAMHVFLPPGADQRLTAFESQSREDVDQGSRASPPQKAQAEPPPPPSSPTKNVDKAGLNPGFDVKMLFSKPNPISASSKAKSTSKDQAAHAPPSSSPNQTNPFLQNLSPKTPNDTSPSKAENDKPGQGETQPAPNSAQQEEAKPVPPPVPAPAPAPVPVPSIEKPITQQAPPPAPAPSIEKPMTQQAPAPAPASSEEMAAQEPTATPIPNTSTSKESPVRDLPTTSQEESDQKPPPASDPKQPPQAEAIIPPPESEPAIPESEHAIAQALPPTDHNQEQRPPVTNHPSPPPPAVQTPSPEPLPQASLAQNPASHSAKPPELVSAKQKTMPDPSIDTGSENTKAKITKQGLLLSDRTDTLRRLREHEEFKGLNCRSIEDLASLKHELKAASHSTVLLDQNDPAYADCIDYLYNLSLPRRLQIRVVLVNEGGGDERMAFGQGVDQIIWV